MTGRDTKKKQRGRTLASDHLLWVVYVLMRTGYILLGFLVQKRVRIGSWKRVSFVLLHSIVISLFSMVMIEDREMTMNTPRVSFPVLYLRALLRSTEKRNMCENTINTRVELMRRGRT